MESGTVPRKSVALGVPTAPRAAGWGQPALPFTRRGIPAPGAVTGNDLLRGEGFLDGAGHLGGVGFITGLEAGDDLAVAAHQELAEVPFQVAGERGDPCR